MSDANWPLGKSVLLADVLAAYRRGHLDSARFEEDLRRLVCERLIKENSDETDEVCRKLNTLETNSLAGRAEWWRLQNQFDRLMAQHSKLSSAAWGKR